MLVVVIDAVFAFSFPYANTFSNTVSLPAIIANAIKDVITIEFILPLVIKLFNIYFFKFQ